MSDGNIFGQTQGGPQAKSSSRAVGANELSDICLALETAGMEGAGGGGEATVSMAPKLEGALAEVSGYIERLGLAPAQKYMKKKKRPESQGRLSGR